MTEVLTSMLELEKLIAEVRTFWELYKLGVLTFPEVIVEINHRRVALGYKELSDIQVAGLLRRGML
jgi:hypothetical protein